MEDNENQQDAGGTARDGQSSGGDAGTQTLDINSLPQEWQAHVRALRRENQTRRHTSDQLLSENTALKTRVQELEGKFASADTNAKDLLASKNQEIESLQSQLRDANTKLNSYKSLEDDKKTELLAKLPATLQKKYESFPLEAVQAIVEDFVATGALQQQGSQNVESPTNRENITDLERELQIAVDSNDLTKINEVLAKMETAENKGANTGATT